MRKSKKPVYVSATCLILTSCLFRRALIESPVVVILSHKKWEKFKCVSQYFPMYFTTQHLPGHVIFLSC